MTDREREVYLTYARELREQCDIFEREGFSKEQAFKLMLLWQVRTLNGAEKSLPIGMYL